ncbi:hypothetical protein V1525DRAFT_410917 [Lipomyces kononenkoae]|uniref:Uncharacterized protein n=1 Tax=Lipomyces kononenkoae TaxID=34357 RepID=A0ACC3SU03_LIPKO
MQPMSYSGSSSGAVLNSSSVHIAPSIGLTVTFRELATLRTTSAFGARPDFPRRTAVLQQRQRRGNILRCSRDNRARMDECLATIYIVPTTAIIEALATMRTTSDFGARPDWFESKSVPHTKFDVLSTSSSLCFATQLESWTLTCAIQRTATIMWAEHLTMAIASSLWRKGRISCNCTTWDFRRATLRRFSPPTEKKRTTSLPYRISSPYRIRYLCKCNGQYRSTRGLPEDVGQVVEAKTRKREARPGKLQWLDLGGAMFVLQNGAKNLTRIFL